MGRGRHPVRLQPGHLPGAHPSGLARGRGHRRRADLPHRARP
jgi:hypothetical protein